MKDYIYDGTFEGLLTCIWHHYYTEKAAGIYTADAYQVNMLYGCQEVESDEAKWSRVYDAINNKISDFALRQMYRAYLSCDKDKGIKLLRFAELGFREGPKVTSLHGAKAVYDMEQLTIKVGNEKEKMLQFVRFRVMNCGSDEAIGSQAVLYAEIEPDNDVLELIASHFCDRYRKDPFIIRDVGRNKAIAGYDKKWYIMPFYDEDVPTASADEIHYRKLWKTYFDHIAIKERANKRCQQNFVPERYRKHLTEFMLNY